MVRAQTLIRVESGANIPDSIILRMRNGSRWVGVPQRSVPVEPVADVSPGSLAQLPSEKVVLVRRFSCTEFELRARVAIALNRF